MSGDTGAAFGTNGCKEWCALEFNIICLKPLSIIIMKLGSFCLPYLMLEKVHDHFLILYHFTIAFRHEC